jgi:hypothetical protein
VLASVEKELDLHRYFQQVQLLSLLSLKDAQAILIGATYVSTFPIYFLSLLGQTLTASVV